MTMANNYSIKQILRRFSQSVRFSEIPPELRIRIHRLCADFVGGPWTRVRPDDLTIKHLRGGTSNMLFICALPTNQIAVNGVQQSGTKVFTGPSTPSELLLRIYFNPNTENYVMEESVVVTLLAERKLGPKLYGVFNEGRLEEFIHARALTTAEIHLPIVSAKVARILAQIHQLTMPVDKRPVYLRDSMRKWLSQLRALYKAKGLDTVVVARSVGVEKVLTLDELEDEMELVIKCIENSPSPIVFCHNDFQEGNILVKSPDPNCDNAEFGVIDYEYASYNYRACDIANHFCEWTIDYHSNHDHPYYHSNPDEFPSENQQRLFAKNYLKEINDHLAPNGLEDVPSEDVETLVDEVKSFVPVSHFFWGLWSLLLAETSPVQFGFMEYAHFRLENYYHLRQDLLRLLNVTTNET